MGTSCSSLGSRVRKNNGSSQRKLSSFIICGGSTSNNGVIDEEEEEKMVECPAALASNAEHPDNHDDAPQRSIIADEPQRSKKNSLSVLHSRADNVISCESSNGPNGIVEAPPIEYSSRHVETTNDGKCLSESKEVPSQSDIDHIDVDSYLERTNSIASSSCIDQQPLHSVTINVGSSLDPVVDSCDGVCSTSTCPEGHEGPCTDSVLPIDAHADEGLATHSSDSTFVPGVSDSVVTLQSVDNDSTQEVDLQGQGLHLPNRRQDSMNETVLHVDVVSISPSAIFSNTRETSNREASRNSRRLFWDAFSRRGSRRHGDPSTLVTTSQDTNDMISQDRWLLSVSNDLPEADVGGDLGYLSSRSHGTRGEQRHSTSEATWRSRSEIWERLREGFDESSRQTTLCASGLHPDGTCSCESFLTAEESGNIGSISRILMLAEALFEVLDEIHRQPVLLSLSMVSLPAPESVVNSFPIKNHKKPTVAQCEDYVEQCHICLSEYEDDDKIRVLPCRHEFHASCVDRWLKEIHGVCPLCRGDVCESAAGSSIQSS